MRTAVIYDSDSGSDHDINDIEMIFGIVFIFWFILWLWLKTLICILKAVTHIFHYYAQGLFELCQFLLKFDWQ